MSLLPQRDRLARCEGVPYPSDLTDEQWELLDPVFNAPGKRGRKHADDLRSVVTPCFTFSDRLPVALLAGVVRAVESGLVAVPTLVSSRHLGKGAHGSARGGWACRGDSVNAGYRHTPCPGCVQRRGDVPQPRRPVRSYQRRQACHRRRCDRASDGCPGTTGLHPREPSERPDAGPPDAPCDAWAGTTSSRCSGPSATPGESRSPTAAWAGPVDSRSPCNTTASATGWLLVACLATTLRHMSRARMAPSAMVAAA